MAILKLDATNSMYFDSERDCFVAQCPYCGGFVELDEHESTDCCCGISWEITMSATGTKSTHQHCSTCTHGPEWHDENGCHNACHCKQFL